MAKKPLGVPLAPAGPQYDFFLHMQELVLNCGDLSLAGMASKVHVSRQVLHRALRGPDLPSRDLVERIVDGIYPTDEGVDAEAKKQAKKVALDAYSRAVAYQRDRARDEALAKDAGHKPAGGRLSAIAAPERERLRDLLQLAHKQADRPSLQSLARNMRPPVADSTISDWLLGKSVPRSFDPLRQLFELLSHRSRGPNQTVVTRAEAERLWNTVVDAQAAARRRPRAS